MDDKTRLLFKYIEEGKNIFITGKAGTGKTYLLHKIVERYCKTKRIAVVAPTGIAAENTGGVTMHRLLHLPLVPFNPNLKMKGLYRLDHNDEIVVQNLDMIIIDEIGMVRCDMLDATDKILRHYRHSSDPFGGIQVLMFGDLYQLMPVTTAEDSNILQDAYGGLSFYFFSSHVFPKLNCEYIVLNHVYRQDNQDFINILNDIREGKITDREWEKLEERYDHHYRPSNDQNIIVLETHNRKAKRYNNQRLWKLDGEDRSFQASKDNWYGHDYPNSLELRFKIGARVMFIKNDAFDRYVNGTMGTVTGFGQDSIEVKIDGKDGSIPVGRETWRQLKYEMNPETKEMKTMVSGTFRQFPIKLAWAVTVHKSQGLTFDRVVLNLGDAFTYGQVYVALSRCRSLEGITLISHICKQSVKAGPAVKEFMASIEGKLVNASMSERKAEFHTDEMLTLHAKSNKIANIANGTGHKYSRSVKDMDLARKVFVTDEEGNLVLNVQLKDKKSVEIHNMHYDHCPFTIQEYKVLRLVSTKNGDEVVVEIKDAKVTKDNAENNWKITYLLGSIISSE